MLLQLQTYRALQQHKLVVYIPTAFRYKWLAECEDLNMFCWNGAQLLAVTQ